MPGPETLRVFLRNKTRLHRKYNRPQPQAELDEGKITHESESGERSVIERPAANWARCVGCKNVQYMKMEHAPRISAQTAREAEKRLSTELNLLMPETKNDEKLRKALGP